MNKLWKFASNADSFDLKDIEDALSEIQVEIYFMLGGLAVLGLNLKLAFRKYWRRRRHLKVSWKNLKESGRILFWVKKTGCACWVKTGVASHSPPLAESALGSSSSVSPWVLSVAAVDANAAEVAVRNDTEEQPPTSCRLQKTSTSMSPLTTAMILGRKNKI